MHDYLKSVEYLNLFTINNPFYILQFFLLFNFVATLISIFGIGLSVIVQALILYIVLPFYSLYQHIKCCCTHGVHCLFHIHSKHKANINVNAIGLSTIIEIIKYSKFIVVLIQTGVSVGRQEMDK